MEAFELTEAWTRFPVIENTVQLLMTAMTLKETTGYSLRDCLIVAAAQAGSCKELYTEDLTHGRSIAGVTIINPFR